MKNHILTACMTSLLLLGACSGSGGKCEKVIDKTVTMVTEMASAMGEAMGDADKADEAKKEMMAEIEAKKPEMLEKCEAALKANPEAGKALDCIIEADSMEDMQKCDSEALDAMM